MHAEFCLPYDQKQIRAIHDAGALVSYHLCGGLMPLLELVVQNGADALETVRRMVHELFACCPNGGYIVSPSDHFFEGDPENLFAFVRAAKECVY